MQSEKLKGPKERGKETSLNFMPQSASGSTNNEDFQGTTKAMDDQMHDQFFCSPSFSIFIDIGPSIAPSSAP